MRLKPLPDKRQVSVDAYQPTRPITTGTSGPRFNSWRYETKAIRPDHHSRPGDGSRQKASTGFHIRYHL